MRYFFIFIFFIPFINAELNAQNYAISNLSLTHLLEKDESIVRSDDYQVEIHSPSKMTIRRKKAVTYLKETDDELSPVLSFDDQSEIKDFKLKIYNSSGELVREYKHRDAKDVACLSYSIYEDSRLQYFDIGKCVFPLTVEYEYEKRYNGVMYYEPWTLQSFNQSIEKASCEIIIPEEMELYYRFQNLDEEASVNYKGKSKVYRWEVKDLNSTTAEAYTPHHYQLLPSLQFGTNEFEIEKYSGSYADWNTFGRFLDQFYSEAQELPESVVEEVNAMTKHISGDREKIRILYDYLQEKTRYVSVQIGIGGWKTYDAEYVADHQYGDCKALSNYMATLLKSANIKAVPVIIERGHNPYEISEDFVFNRFNHAILYVPSIDQFIECTADSGPEDYIGSDNEGRKILLVDGDNSRIGETPTTPTDKNLRKSHTDIFLQKDGMAIVRTDQLNQYHRQERLRSLLTSLDKTEFDKVFRSSFPITIYSMDNFQYKIQEEEPVVKIEYKLSSKEIATPMGNRLFVNLNPLFRPETNIPNSKERKLPIHITNYGVDSNTYHFHIPEEYQLESQPSSPITIESEWGQYRLSIELSDDNVLKVERYFRFEPVREEADQYAAIESFYDNVHKSDKETKVVFVAK